MPQTLESLAGKLQESLTSPDGTVYSPRELVEVAAIKLWQALEKKDRAPLDDFLANLPEKGKMLSTPLEGNFTLLAFIGNALREHDLIVTETDGQFSVRDRHQPAPPSQEINEKPVSGLVNTKVSKPVQVLDSVIEAYTPAGKSGKNKKPKPLAG